VETEDRSFFWVYKEDTWWYCLFPSLAPCPRLRCCVVNGPNPLVLFTHIPLYRPDGKRCGPLREKGTIRPGVGFGYQNTLGKQATFYLLDQIRPIVVFRCVLFSSSFSLKLRTSQAAMTMTTVNIFIRPSSLNPCGRSLSNLYPWQWTSEDPLSSSYPYFLLPTGMTFIRPMPTYLVSFQIN